MSCSDDEEEWCKKKIFMMRHMRVSRTWIILTQKARSSSTRSPSLSRGRSSVVHPASHKVRVAMIGTARAVPRDYIRIDCGEFLVSNTSRPNSQYILYK